MTPKIKNLLPEKEDAPDGLSNNTKFCYRAGYNRAVKLCESKLKEAFEKGVIKWGRK